MSEPTHAVARAGHCPGVIKALRDGTLILIRPIRYDDKWLLEAELESLSETSVQRRFLAPKPRYTRSELRYLTEVDGWNHMALVAESPIRFGRRILGVARYVRDREDPRKAEVAIEVVDDFQGRGLGTLLVEALGRRARMRGITRFTATMASANIPAQRLFRRLTGQTAVQHLGSGASELEGELAA
ncbi:MAG TPA: GNAT family N-acetyltransferase [Thermoleophilaceae bacterium]|nr:GNAT family N-acetyltransferase [Thermoleophilaceae bacterium]